jgi:hypothetical protein
VRPPIERTKEIARDYGCDLAIPNGPGIGNVVCYTRLVEEVSLSLGRPLRLLTAPLDPRQGRRSSAHPYPLWEANPFVRDIVDLERLDSRALSIVNQEKDDLCQFSHVIENLCSAYGVRPRALRGSLFLHQEEMRAALDSLAHLKRPVVALHPFGKTSSPAGSRWYSTQWQRLVERNKNSMSFLQLGFREEEDKDIGAYYPDADIRSAIALIWASDLFVGFDSGLAHIATALQKPVTVLWDASHKEPIESRKEPGFAASLLLRWAYPHNRNLVILGEREDEVLHLCEELVTETLRSFKREI